MKILFFDIENIMAPEHIFNSGKPSRFQPRQAGFCADLAYILVFGYKWLGDKEAKYIVGKKKDFKDNPLTDEYILDKIYDVMNEADVLVTWYGSGHDYPFTVSRLAKHGKYLDTDIRHVDLQRVATKKLRLSSNRLNNVAKFFGLEQKTQIAKKIWADTWQGNYDSLLEMAEYCKQDVVVLEQIYHKMKQLGTSMPHIGKLLEKGEHESCATCGSSKVYGNGRRVTKTRSYKRLRCAECGAHQKGLEIE